MWVEENLNKQGGGHCTEHRGHGSSVHHNSPWDIDKETVYLPVTGYWVGLQGVYSISANSCLYVLNSPFLFIYLLWTMNYIYIMEKPVVAFKFSFAGLNLKFVIFMIL